MQTQLPADSELNPICQSILTQHFNYIAIVNLNKYMRCMSKVYNILKSVKKSSFDHRDRIVFTLFDHDFYLNNNGPGWTLHNLQLILDDLDISNFFCLLLTNQPNYNDHTTLVQTQLTIDKFPIRSITTWLNNDFVPKEIIQREPLIENIKVPYCLLSRQSRPYRTFFVSKLMHENLLDSGIIGYNNILETPINSNNNNNLDIENLNFSFLEIPTQWQKVLLRNQLNRDIYREFHSQYTHYKNFEDKFDIRDKDKSCSLSNPAPISNALLYIGLETEVTTPTIHSSRISIRGIIERRPFVLFACPGALKQLRDRGFKTFEDFWSEDYDTIQDVETRVDRIIEIIKYVASMSTQELKLLYQQMQSTIDYNYNFYRDGLVDREKRSFTSAILKNLKSN
jgi:hypothetical protein